MSDPGGPNEPEPVPVEDPGEPEDDLEEEDLEEEDPDELETDEDPEEPKT